MSSRDQTSTVRDRRVRLWRAGSGQPLLYRHDTFSYGWTSVQERLAKHYDGLMPVHPGGAGSCGLDDMDTLEDLVFHYLDVCATLGVERPILLGSSLGGWLAAAWAVRYSDRLRGLILVDAFGLRLPDTPTAALLRLDPAHMRAVVFADPDSAVPQDLGPDVPSPETLEATLQARHTLARFAWQCPDNPKLLRYLYRVQTPTLILWGAQDGVVSTTYAQAYAQGIRGAEVVVFSHCGPLPHAEQPGEFVRAVLSYVSRVG